MIETVLLICLVVVALGVVGLVLIQHGKGADMGASFGSGASQTLFGSQGTGNFLTKSTSFLAFVFFAVCLALGYIAREKAEQKSEFDFGFGESAQVVEQVEGSDIPVVDGAPKVEVSVDSDVPATAEVADTAAKQVKVAVEGVKAKGVESASAPQDVADEADMSQESAQ